MYNVFITFQRLVLGQLFDHTWCYDTRDRTQPRFGAHTTWYNGTWT